MLVVHRKLFDDYPHWTNRPCWCDPTYIEDSVEWTEDGITVNIPDVVQTDIEVEYPMDQKYLH